MQDVEHYLSWNIILLHTEYTYISSYKQPVNKQLAFEW